MPGWNTKSWKQTCQAGKPNPGNKHARVGKPDSGAHLSVQSPFSGGPSLFYFNVQRFHCARYRYLSLQPFSNPNRPRQKEVSQIEVKGSFVIPFVGWLPRTNLLVFASLGIPVLYNLPRIFTCQSWSSRLWYAPFGAIPLFRRLYGMTCMELFFSPCPLKKTQTLPFLFSSHCFFSSPLFFFTHHPAVSPLFFLPIILFLLQLFCLPIIVHENTDKKWKHWIPWRWLIDIIYIIYK